MMLYFLRKLRKMLESCSYLIKITYHFIDRFMIYIEKYFNLIFIIDFLKKIFYTLNYIKDITYIFASIIFLLYCNHQYCHSYLFDQLPAHVFRHDCHHLHHATWFFQRNVKWTLFVAVFFAIQFASQAVSLTVQD